jgi:fimbrial chaperone protein
MRVRRRVGPTRGSAARRGFAPAFRSGLLPVLYLLLVLAPSPAAAFRLVPMVMDFAPAGRGATQSFGIVNDTDRPIAAEVSIVRRQVDLDGKETYTPEEDDFIVYPPQMVVMPGKVQIVQVRWVGAAKPEKELPFRIIAEQLPIKLDRQQPKGERVAQIGILFRYEGSVYVLPKGAKPDIALESIRATKRKDGSPGIEVVVRNRGTSHGFVKKPTLTITAAPAAGGLETQVVLGPKQLGDLLNLNVLAGHRRRVVLPWPEGLGEGALDAHLEAKIVR